MNGGYTQDCVAHACELAQRFAAEGKRPWIGRVRDQHGDYHEPLMPLRFAGGPAPVWNVHYICCVDGDVYDPIVGAAVPVEDFAQVVFGKVLPVIEHVSPDTTADLLQRGELRRAFRVTR